VESLKVQNKEIKYFDILRSENTEMNIGTQSIGLA